MVLVIAVTVGLEALTPGKFAGMLVASVGVVILTAERAGKGSGSHLSGDSHYAGEHRDFRRVHGPDEGIGGAS